MAQIFYFLQFRSDFLNTKVRTCIALETAYMKNFSISSTGTAAMAGPTVVWTPEQWGHKGKIIQQQWLRQQRQGCQ